ncbi:uncharacterized protein V1518DRAFT_423947 [Limtongia smithiae]|uniref:uncharacterized protein n=1 Tax=Limtongia smithiae TaxID=1125753 RepID=UPI0034CD777A
MSASQLRLPIPNTSRSPSRQPTSPLKNAQYYTSPGQGSIAPDMLYENLPSSPVMRNKQEQYLDNQAQVSDATTMHMMTRIWNQQRLMPSARRVPAMLPEEVAPALRPPRYGYNTLSDTLGQEAMRTRYDVLSRLPMQSFIPTEPSPMLPSQSVLSSDVSSAYEYSDFEPHYYDRSDTYTYTDISSPEPTYAAPTVPLDSNIVDYRQTTLESSPYLNLNLDSDEYEADYLSDGLSPCMSSTEDTSDFSSPELQQNNKFALDAQGKPQIPMWTTTWQPILIADPATSQKLVLPVEPSDHDHEEKRERLPSRILDDYVVGPNADGKYICSYQDCGKTFGRRYNIRTHIQTHLSNKPHKCPVCDSRFVRQHDLRRHVKIHEDEKPFLCPCGKAFARHDALVRHRLRGICEGRIDDEKIS